MPNMNLQNRSSQELMVMLHNIMRAQDTAAAKTRKKILYQELANRNRALCSGKNIDVMPSDGALSAFGYHVGDGGITRAEQRQLILTYLLEAPMPPVVDRDYTQSWGLPNSSISRKEKLLRTLKGLASGVKNRGAYGRTISYARGHYHTGSKTLNMCKVLWYRSVTAD